MVQRVRDFARCQVPAFRFGFGTFGRLFGLGLRVAAHGALGTAPRGGRVRSGKAKLKGRVHIACSNIRDGDSAGPPARPGRRGGRSGRRRIVRARGRGAAT